jgi:hypothetical protein
MTETRIWSHSRILPARAQASAAGGRSGRARRAGARLWSLLHAPGLLNGTCGGPYDVAFVEDDRRRLAARQTR